MSRAASGQHPLPLDFYHTFVLHLPCFHHTSTAFLPYFFHASTMLQPYFYHASTGVYLLGNQWCSPWSLVSDLTSSGFFSSPIGVPVPLFFQCRRGQGGRTWQPFVGSKNGNENFRQVHIYNFRVKCVVFERNRKFAKLTR